MSDYDVERRFPRLPAEHTALLRTLDAGTESFARTRDLSLGGCGITTREDLEPGLAVELLMTIDGRIVQVFGRTVYRRELDGGQIEIGVEFLDVLDEDVELLRQVLSIST